MFPDTRSVLSADYRTTLIAVFLMRENTYSTPFLLKWLECQGGVLFGPERVYVITGLRVLIVLVPSSQYQL